MRADNLLAEIEHQRQESDIQYEKMPKYMEMAKALEVAAARARKAETPKEQIRYVEITGELLKRTKLYSPSGEALKDVHDHIEYAKDTMEDIRMATSHPRVGMKASYVMKEIDKELGNKREHGNSRELERVKLAENLT